MFFGLPNFLAPTLKTRGEMFEFRLSETVDMSISCLLTFDSKSLQWISELTDRISSLNQIVPRPVEFSDLVRRIPSCAAALNCKTLPTGRANEYRVVFEPIEALCDLMRALRTRDGVGDFVCESPATRMS